METFTIKQIEKSFLCQIDYMSEFPYIIKTYHNPNWKNRYNPPKFPPLFHIEISNDYNSILFNNRQYFLQDSKWYTKTEYEHI